jgi:putative glycosyltransferase (TIGR04372 family)
MFELAGQYKFVRYREDMLQYFTAIGETAKYNDIFSKWGERAPLLELAPSDIERGEAALRQLGLPEGARFVCFHSRDAGYSPNDERWHSYRNTSVESYLPAMTALYERGLYGMRMGDPTMPAMPETDGLIDYARSPLRSDWMDVFLCARCEFFLGNSSGLYLVSIAFGRPTALANLAPMSSTLGGGPRELGIPKLLWLEKEHRHLRFAEIFSTPVANYRFAEQYQAAGILTPDPQRRPVRR